VGLVADPLGAAAPHGDGRAVPYPQTGHPATQARSEVLGRLDAPNSTRRVSDRPAAFFMGECVSQRWRSLEAEMTGPRSGSRLASKHAGIGRGRSHHLIPARCSPVVRQQVTELPGRCGRQACQYVLQTHTHGSTPKR
jgi:hypothetical protein